jgi:hypothetical protein
MRTKTGHSEKHSDSLMLINNGAVNISINEDFIHNNCRALNPYQVG